MKKNLREEAAEGAVSAGDVSSVALPLMASVQKRTLKKPRYKVKRITFNQKPFQFLKMFEDMNAATMAQEFDRTEVINKLKNIEANNGNENKNSTTFGLEDDDKNVIRVTVQSDQADEFERTLRSILTDVETEGEVPDIAEILFDMRHLFDIIDVDYPEFEDEEDGPLKLNVEPDEEAIEEPEDVAPPMDDAGTEDVSSLLKQVVDMMKADADARRAEAVARQREAETSAEDARTRHTMAAVSREEELLDMEDKMKQATDHEKEIERLAKLSQWKKDSAEKQLTSNDEVDFGMGEPEPKPKEEEEIEVQKQPIKVSAYQALLRKIAL